jgi:hypothetical protein
MVPSPSDSKTDLGNHEQWYYFRNVTCGDVFDENMSFKAPQPRQDAHSMDFSLQVQSSIIGFWLWVAAAFPKISEQHVDDFHVHVPGKKMLPHKEALAKTLRGDIDVGHSQSK